MFSDADDGMKGGASTADGGIGLGAKEPEGTNGAASALITNGVVFVLAIEAADTGTNDGAPTESPSRLDPRDFASATVSLMPACRS